MNPKIAVKLRDAMNAYKRRTRERMTYQILAERTGIAVGTLHNIGSRADYNTTLATLAKICHALDVAPGDMLEMIPDPPKPKRRPKRKSAGR